METILLRRRHRERQAWDLVRAALFELEAASTSSTTAAADTAADGKTSGGKRGARTLEALHAKVRVCVVVVIDRIDGGGPPIQPITLRMTQHRPTAPLPATPLGRRGCCSHRTERPA